MTDADAILSAGVFHGEGAFWDDRVGCLRFVDMLRGDIVTATDTGAGIGAERVSVGKVAAVIRRRRASGFVVATEHGFALTDEALHLTESIPVLDDPDVRMNEGGVDPAGRLFVGTMRYDMAAGGGTMYRLDPDHTVSIAWQGVTIPNGLVWTPTGDAAFHADTGDATIWRYAVDPVTGAFGEREAFVSFAEGDGLPDGMAMDAEGGLWVALWGGAAVRRFDANGTADTEITLPTPQVTSCAFGDDDGRTLFITTSRQNAPESDPRAGSLFAARVGITGAAVHAYGG